MKKSSKIAFWILALGASVAFAVTLSLQGALNALVMAPQATTYSTQQALNILVQGHADSTHKYSQQAAANRLVNHGARLAIPSARTGSGRVNGQWTTIGTTADLSSAPTGDTVRVHFVHSHSARIRRTGNVTKIRIYLGQGTEQAITTRITVQLWERTAGGRLYLRYDSPNLLTGTGAGIREYIPATPIPVEKGYYYAIYCRKVAGQASGNIFDAIARANAALLSQANVNPSPTSMNWYAQTAAVSAFEIPVEFYMAPTQVVAIGYSHIGGSNLQVAYGGDASRTSSSGDTAAVSDPAFISTTWDSYFSTTLRPGVTIDNVGGNGETAAAIIVRASGMCFQARPRVAILQMGGNDTDSTLIYTHTSTFLDSCVTRDVIPVVVGMSPMTSKPGGWAPSALAFMYWRDRVNKSVQVLCQIHPAGAIYVETDGLLGKNRVAGPIGNRWDIQTTPDYSAGDDLHYTELGQQAFAQAIANALTYDFTR